MTDAPPPTPPAGAPTYSSAQPPASEDVVKGGLFALVALPVGVVLLVLLSSIGFVASVVGFVVAALALFLYRRGSGGFISRNGALVVTGIVIVTLLIGIRAALLVEYAGGLGHLDLLVDPAYQQSFSENFGTLVSRNFLFIVLILAFGALGAFRTLSRAFAIARAPRTTEQIFGQAPGSASFPAPTSAPASAPTSAPFAAPFATPTAPSAAQSPGAPGSGTGSGTGTGSSTGTGSNTNDIDGAPTGSADDKTAPPSLES